MKEGRGKRRGKLGGATVRVSLERKEEDRGDAGGHCSRGGCWLAGWRLACWSPFPNTASL